MLSIQTLSGTDVDTALLASINHLLAQLSTSAQPVTMESLTAILSQPGQQLLIGRHDGDIVGMLTLVLVPLLTGLRGHIEDVVVDQTARGLGVGTALVNAAQKAATAAGARTLDLTSRPERSAAHRLYASVGFSVRDTAVYRWTPTD